MIRRLADISEEIGGGEFFYHDSDTGEWTPQPCNVYLVHTVGGILLLEHVGDGKSADCLRAKPPRTVRYNGADRSVIGFRSHDDDGKVTITLEALTSEIIPEKRQEEVSEIGGVSAWNALHPERQLTFSECEYSALDHVGEYNDRCARSGRLL